MTLRHHLVHTVLFSAFVSTTCLTTTQAEERSGITVMGVGKIDAKPTIVELTGTINGEAELAGDAVTKFRGNRQTAIEAIEAL